MGIFHPLEIVDRGSETQLQMGGGGGVITHEVWIFSVTVTIKTFSLKHKPHIIKLLLQRIWVLSAKKREIKCSPE